MRDLNNDKPLSLCNDLRGLKIIGNLNDTVLNNSGCTCSGTQPNKNCYKTIITNMDGTLVM